MLSPSDPAVFVTGATGFLGRHLVPRLLNGGRRVVVLVRRRGPLSAAQRTVEGFGELADRLEVLEGDIAFPEALEKTLDRLRSTIATVIHCAGETSFSAGALNPTRVIHVDGPLALLGMLAGRGLRRWCHISTAFVCGRRSGIVREIDSDVGQPFHNSYERLKLQSEIAFKQACRELEIDLRILRPTIIVGAAPATSGGAPSNLLRAFVRLLVSVAGSADRRDGPIRVRGLPHARFNIVPVDYVAAAIERLAEDPGASGGTFHVAAANAPTQQEILDMLGGFLDLPELRLLGPQEMLPSPSSLELKIQKMLLPYKAYLEQDVQFDCAGAYRLLHTHSVRVPGIRSEIERLIERA